MQRSHSESRMVMALLLEAMTVDVSVPIVTVGVVMGVDLGAMRPTNRPRPDSEKDEPDGELCPIRPCLDIDKAAQAQAESAHDQDGHTVTESPKGSTLSRLWRVLQRQWSKSRQMVGTGKDMQASGGQPGQDRDHRRHGNCPGTLSWLRSSNRSW